MDFDEIISLGSNCNPGIALRRLNLKSEAYPFDWVRSNSKIIYDLLLNGRKKYLTFDDTNISEDFYVKELANGSKNTQRFNYYGQHFLHYHSFDTESLVKTFNRYFDRFFNLLNSNKRVLFIYSNAEYIYYKKMRDDREILYDYLCKINDIFVEQYPNLIFKIINVDINNHFKNYKNIININMDYNYPLTDVYDKKYADHYETYRTKFTSIVKNFVKEKPTYVKYMKYRKYNTI